MKAVLTGEGSDEIFGGYSFFRQDFLRHHLDDVAKARGLKLTIKDKDEYTQSLRHTSLLWGSEGSKWMKDEAEQMVRESVQLLGYTPSMLQSIPFIHFNSFFSPALREKYSHLGALYYHPTSSPSFDQRLIQKVREGHVGKLNGSLYLEVKTMLANTLLKWLGDSMEMAHSVEGRTPFLDHHLVDYVNRLPFDLKIRLTSSPDRPLHLNEKYLLKRAAAPFLPAAIVNKEKHPFLAPPTLLNAQSVMFHHIHETVRGREMEELRGIVDVDRVRHALDAIDREVAEGRQATLDLQELLKLEQWLLMFEHTSHGCPHCFSASRHPLTCTRAFLPFVCVGSAPSTRCARFSKSGKNDRRSTMDMVWFLWSYMMRYHLFSPGDFGLSSSMASTMRVSDAMASPNTSTCNTECQVRARRLTRFLMMESSSWRGWS